MGRILKTNRFDEFLWNKLKELSDKVGIDVSKLLDEAISLLLAKYLKPEPVSTAKHKPMERIDINDPNMPKDLISMSDTFRKYHIPFPTMAKWIVKGFIKQYHPKVKGKAKSFLSESELINYLELRKTGVEIKGDLIPMVEACKRYHLSDNTLSGWVKKGWLKKYERPETFPESIMGRSFISITELEKYLESRK